MVTILHNACIDISSVKVNNYHNRSNNYQYSIFYYNDSAELNRLYGDIAAYYGAVYTVLQVPPYSDSEQHHIIKIVYSKRNAPLEEYLLICHSMEHVTFLIGSI